MNAYNGAIKIVRWMKNKDMSTEKFFLKLDKDKSGSLDSKEFSDFVIKTKDINIDPIQL
jgi:hypothetical protein